MAVAEQLRSLAAGRRPQDGLQHVLRLAAGGGVPAGLQRLGPLRLGAAGDAGDAQDVPLLPNAARIGDDAAGVRLQGKHVQVADRVDEAGVRRWAVAQLAERDGGAGVDGEYGALLQTGEHAEKGGEAAQVVDVAGAVQRHQYVGGGVQPQPRQRPGRLIGPRQEVKEGVRHDVAHRVDAGADPLGAQVLRRGRRRAEEEAGAVVGEDAVDLLRHAPVEAAETGLHMGEANVELGGDQRPRQRGVRVAVDEHDVRRLGLHERLQGQHHARRLLTVAAGTHAQVPVRARHLQLLQEYLAHVRVVVLAGVHQQFVVQGPERAADRRRLDVLGSRSYGRYGL